MKTLLIAGALALAASLGGCASQGLSPDQTHQLLTDFHAAGCGGRVDLDAGAATGQVGGEAHIQLGLHGDCPSAGGPVAAPAAAAAASPAAAPPAAPAQP